MKTVSRGMLGYRLTQSCSRMECKHYLPEAIWTADKNSWPGDWEGRTILGLVSLAKATGKEPSYLEEMLDLLPEHLNELGYMGEIYPDGQISEQQLAGNSWLLRGLIEYTDFKKDDRLVPIIEKLLKNLYLPVIGNIKDYPIEKYEKEGTYSGSIIAKRGKWLLSTDVGCAFISMDGISAAYGLFMWDELRRLLDEMIKRFKEVDLCGSLYQTHATLSALRGVMRTYSITHEARYLELVKDRFALYLEKAQTENNSNTNRFQMAKWTEPCGLIDSYMVAVELYRVIGQPKYLEEAQKIYLNSISHAQIPNGGMGLENCVGFEGNTCLSFQKNKDGSITEAFWCCTMRGADGLSYVSDNQCMKIDNVYTFIHFFNCQITDGSTTITVKTKYPYEGKVQISVTSTEGAIVPLRLFIPSCMQNLRINGKSAEADGCFITLEARDAEIICIDFDIPPVIEETRQGFFKASHGLMLLGCTSSDEYLPELKYIGMGVYMSEDGRRFSSVGETVLKETAQVETEELRILFRRP